MRLRADFWVSAYIRRCEVEGAIAVLRRRGAPEAGGIYIKLDRLDGRVALYGPAPRGDDGKLDERRFLRAHKDEWIETSDAEARLKREISFDSDIWIVEVEDRLGRTFVDIVD